MGYIAHHKVAKYINSIDGIMSALSVQRVKDSEACKSWTKLHLWNRLIQQHTFLRQHLIQVWFSVGTPSLPNCSRDDVFHRDNWRCAYCDKELRGSAEATIDHLIPRRLFRSEALANQNGNRVSACRQCNLLKGHWYPRRLHSRAWTSRAFYILAVRSFVRERRLKNMSV